MELTRANLDAVFTGLQAVLNQGLSMASANWNRFATAIPSKNAIEEYPFVNLPSGMEKWIGDRKISKLDGKKMKVINEYYANAVEVSRSDIERDSIGLYDPFVRDMGINAGNLWDKLAILALATNPTWADDKAFFLSNRKLGKSTINNTVSAALSVTTFESAVTTMMSFCDAAGDPLGLVPDLLVVGPKLRSTAQKIVKSDLIAEVVGEATVAVSNPNKDTCELQVNPLLAGDYDDLWFLMVTTRGMRPVVIQKAKEGTLTRQDRDDHDCVFERYVNRYGIDACGAAAPTFPQLVIGGGFGA